MGVSTPYLMLSLPPGSEEVLQQRDVLNAMRRPLPESRHHETGAILRSGVRNGILRASFTCSGE